MVEDLDLILKTIATVPRRYIKKAWPFGPQCDQIDFFFFGSETIFDVFRRFEKPCDNIAALIDQFYWRLAAERGENRGNGQTRRLPADLIADIRYARYRRFYMPYMPFICLMIFARCARDRRIKSLIVSPALVSRTLLGFLFKPLLR